MSKQTRYNKMWMDVAEVFAQQSYATRRKVGCVIIAGDRIISQGWNGTPTGFDNCCENEFGETLPYVIHAESNALDKITRDGSAGARGATLYVTLAPCIACAMRIANCGITSVYYRDDYRIRDGLDHLSLMNIPTTQI